MNRIIFVGWLISLATAFHFGWWARHRFIKKLKEERERFLSENIGRITPHMYNQIQDEFWRSL